MLGSGFDIFSVNDISLTSDDFSIDTAARESLLLENVLLISFSVSLS